MSKLYQSICLAVLVSISFSAGATKLVVSQGSDNCEFELASGDAVTINPATGDISATVTNLEDCKGQAPDPEILTFSVSSSVDEGNPIQISWNTQHADACQAVTSADSNPLPGWTGSKSVPSGNQTVTAPSPASTRDYQVRLRCSNSVGSVDSVRTVRVNVDDGTTPTECQNRPEPSNLDLGTRALWGDNSADARDFAQIFGSFPGGNNTRHYYQQPGKYHAIKFNTGSMPVGSNGQINSSEPDHPASFVSNVSLGSRFVTISECRGDFHRDQLAPACYRRHANGSEGIFWAEESYSGQDQAARCLLKRNTDYYLNIVYTNAPAGTLNPTWACSGGKPNCGAIVYSTSVPPASNW